MWFSTILESDHIRPVGSELRTRLRDRVGGTALTDLYATGTCIPAKQKQTASRQRSSLLHKEAISPICPTFDETTSEHGFVSQLFAVPKKDGGMRPVVKLEALNSHVQQVPLKVEGIHLLKDILRPGDWMTRVDLKDAYFAIPVSSHDRKFLRFRWQCNRTTVGTPMLSWLLIQIRVRDKVTDRN